MLKKLVWALSLGLLLLVGCSQDVSYNPGTYEGVGRGYSDENLRISVTIAEDGDIYEIRVLESGETEDIGGRALDTLVQDALASNGQEADTVSGATRTSEGFREALDDALDQAKGEN